MRRYTDDQVAQALAALDLNGGNVKRTARDLGIPRTTLVRWRDGVSAVSDTEKKEAAGARDLVALWADVQEIGIRRMRELIPISNNLREVAVATGIAADKHLDYDQGRSRSGAEVTVDNRQQQVNVIVEYVELSGPVG